ESRELVAQLEREPRAARHNGVDVRRRAQIVVDEDAGRMLGERGGEGGDVLLLDREPRRGTMAAPAPEERRARTERAVQVERRDRAAGALPVAVGAGDQDDGTVEALDEPGRDDPDHALVPALAGNHVGTPRLVLVGPRLDLLRGFAEDAPLHRLPL